MWGPLSLRAGPAGHTAGCSPIAGGEAGSCRKRKTDFITFWDTRGQTRASVWLLTNPYFVCKIRNEWMEVTESRFHLKRRQNPVPEELEPDMALELEDLRWIPGPSFVYTYIHIWVVQRCSLWDHSLPHQAAISLSCSSLSISIQGLDQLRNARGWDGTIWSTVPLPKKLLVGQFSQVLSGLLGSYLPATGILGPEVDRGTQRRLCPIS